MGGPVKRRVLGKHRWTTAQIEAVKAEIKYELDRILVQSRRLSHMLVQIHKLENQDRADARLRCFVYIMSALVQNQRRRCLKRPQLEGLVQRALIILQVQGIVPGGSRHAFLYGELHQVRSLTLRRDGQTWRAAWEQQLGAAFSRGSDAIDLGHQALASGNRSLRLGNATQALAAFARAEAEGLDARGASLASIGRARALRIQGDIPGARRAAAAALATKDLTPEAHTELMWEAFCLDATTDGALLPMVNATRLGKSHAAPEYVIEAFLWAIAAPSKAFIDRVVKMATLARREDTRPKALGQLLKIALTLEDCYDPAIPFAIRLERLGEVLASAKKVLNVDKELLAWLAAARWLARAHAFALASLCLKEYEQLSLRLSDGRSPDAMGMGADLLTAKWYVEPLPAVTDPRSA